MKSDSKRPLKVTYSCNHEESVRVSSTIHALYRIEGTEETRAMALNSLCRQCQEKNTLLRRAQYHQ